MHPSTTCRYSLVLHPLRVWLILVTTAIVLSVTLTPVHAQENATGNQGNQGNQVDGFPVLLNHHPLFRVKQGISGVVSAEERAKVISERITAIAEDPSISVETIRVDEQQDGSVVKAGEIILFTARNSDQIDEQTRQEMARSAAQQIQTAIRQYREERSLERLVLGVIAAVLSTIALLVFLRTIQLFVSKLLFQIKAARQADTLDIRVQQFQLMNSNVTSYVLTEVLKLLRLTLILASLYLYLPFVLSQFPATKPFGNRILQDIAYRASQLAEGFARYLPNLVTIALIALITYYAIGLVKLVIIELGRDDAYPWFYLEWIRPTIRLATFLIIAIACLIAAPYLPGANSPAFQGVSLFLGALLTLGSSSAIANAIAGVILIYTRAFRIGDMVQIGDIVGEVDEKSLFVTRILTFKQELTTMPNSSILSGNVTNFSAILRESDGHLLLHTTITLGYDVPWRKVYDVLVQAAEATTNILSEPRPFVLQTSLNDFNVAYELNAYTNHPEWMPNIYSNLHQNIQDHCNQAGIEILSPAYTSIRDGNHSTMPSDYLPTNYTSPTFQILNKDGNE